MRRSQVLPGHTHTTLQAPIVVCIAGLWKAVERVLLGAESVYVVGGCNVVATERGRYSLSALYAETEPSWVCMVCCQFYVIPAECGRI